MGAVGRSDVSETLAVVMPVHDEAGTVERVLEALARDVVSRFPAVDVIVVDDASTDETPQILRRLDAAFPWLRIERSDENQGHGPAVRRGLELARADWIFQLDSDDQFVVSDFWKLWDRRSAADLVLGIRFDRHDPRHRLLLSKALAGIVSRLAARPVRDANAPFRLVRRVVWEDIRSFLPRDALAPSMLVSLGAVVRGWRVVEVPVAHLPRTRGESSLRWFRLGRFSVRALAQLYAFRTALRRAPPRASASTAEPK